MLAHRPNLTHPLGGCADLDAGRRAWWPSFRPAGRWGGETRRDVTGRGHAMALSGIPVWGSGPGYAMGVTYDGTALQYGSVPTSVDFDSTSCTWGCSFRSAAALPGAAYWLFGRADPTASLNGVALFLRSTGEVGAQVHSGAAVVADLTGPSVEGDPGFLDGRWHRLLLGVDAAAGIATLYLDGAFADNVALSGSYSFGAYPVRTAVSTDPFWDEFPGAVANEAVWSRAFGLGAAREEFARERAVRPPVRVVVPRTISDSANEYRLSADPIALTGTAQDTTLTPTPPFSGLADPVALTLSLSDVTLTAAGPFSLVMPAAPLAVRLSLGAAALTAAVPPGSSQVKTLVPRVPRQGDERLTRFTEIVASLFNSIAAAGQIRRVGPSEFRLSGAGVEFPRAPDAADDDTRGYARGTVWIDTAADNVYVCANPAAGAAVWRGPL